MQKALARGISQFAAMTIAAAAVGVSLGAIQLAVIGVEGASSRDGLSRIMGPFFVVEGLVFLTLAVGGFSAGWMAIKSRGVRHLLPVIAGALTVLGALPLYGQAPPAHWALPAFSLCVGLFGLGFATGGWLLSVAMRHLPASRAGIAAFLGLAGAVVAFPITTGLFLADFVATETEWPVPPNVRARLHHEAHQVWDSPLERLLYVDVAVAGKFETRHCGQGYTVEALTAFGLHVDWIQVDDCSATSD